MAGFGALHSAVCMTSSLMWVYVAGVALFDHVWIDTGVYSSLEQDRLCCVQTAAVVGSSRQYMHLGLSALRSLLAIQAHSVLLRLEVGAVLCPNPLWRYGPRGTLCPTMTPGPVAWSALSRLVLRSLLVDSFKGCAWCCSVLWACPPSHVFLNGQGVWLQKHPRCSQGWHGCPWSRYVTDRQEPTCWI